MGHVTLDDLTKEYGNETAVKQVDLDITDGEFVTFVGPSGCGKSTTLEMVAGLTDATSGTVAIDDRDVTNVPPKDRSISMVFQNIALFPHMDVRDNISFGLRIRDHDDDEIDRRVERAAETVQIDGMEDRMPDELSGGQRQRVAIARAIVREPEVFLMDEPLANLDAALRVHMRTELQRLHNDLETTIIYVTHDQEEAMTMSNRLAVMNDGQVQQFDTPLRCYNLPANRFVAGFIGSPSMNFLDGRTTKAGLTTPYFDLEYADRADGLGAGEDVTVGVRPEDVALVENRDTLETPSDPITATVDVVEPVGNEIFLYLQVETKTGGAASEFEWEGDDAEQQTGERDAETTSAADDRDSAEILVSSPANPDWNVEEIRASSVELCIDLARVHLFDVDSGEALVHGLTEELEASSLHATSD